jgi:hypothetical protein
LKEKEHAAALADDNTPKSRLQIKKAGAPLRNDSAGLESEVQED